jgi:hypothetical protein
MNMIPKYEPDPAMVAALVGKTTARYVYHNAGHAVAAVAKDRELLWVSPGVVDWTTSDGIWDIPGETEHVTDDDDEPFVTFAGPWAEAMWECHVEDVDFNDAMDVAWCNGGVGDFPKYESFVDELCDRYGSNPSDREWEADWVKELDALWLAVCEVAAILVDLEWVTHQEVLAAVNRCRND